MYKKKNSIINLKLFKTNFLRKIVLLRKYFLLYLSNNNFFNYEILFINISKFEVVVWKLKFSI